MFSLCRHSFHIDGLSLLRSGVHSPGRKPLRAVILFDLIWLVAYRGEWWDIRLSWPSRNKPYQIRHIGLSVLAHTMGINWSSNTTDKSIPSFTSPQSSQANWMAPPFDQQCISSQWEKKRMLTGSRAEVRWGSGSPSESHQQAGAKATAVMRSGMEGSCLRVYLKGTRGPTVMQGCRRSPLFNSLISSTFGSLSPELRVPGRDVSHFLPVTPSYLHLHEIHLH